MRNKGISRLIPVLFLAMVILVLSAVSAQGTDITQIRFRSEDWDLDLSPVYNETEGWYGLYLPAFLSPDSLTISSPWYVQTRLHSGGQSLTSGQDVQLTVSCLWGGEAEYVLRLQQCSAGQTICIDAQEGMLSHIHADQDHSQDVYVTILDGAGDTQYQGASTISGRGNSTWEWQKKPYDLSFSQPVTMGPFQEATKLCLLAEYFDISKLRNALAYHTAQELQFPYASPYVYADLFVNGQYQGLYGVATKKEYEKHIDADGIQAVFELSTSGKGHEFTTDMRKTIRVHYGEEDHIQYMVENMEYALADQDFDRLQEFIDVESWAKKYVLDEFFYNYDLSLTSQYFYLDGSGRIKCMLPWDYEWIMYPRLYPSDLTQEHALCAYWNQKNWYQRLLDLEPFREAVSTVLRETYTPEFLESLTAYMEECEQEIGGSWYCDQLRWSSAYAASHHITPAERPISQYRETFCAFFPARVSFLTELFSHWEDYCLISFWSQFGDTVEEAKLQLILPRGSDFTAQHERILKSTHTPDGWEFLGLYAPDGTPMESIATITENLELTARYRALSPETEVSHE